MRDRNKDGEYAFPHSTQSNISLPLVSVEGDFSDLSDIQDRTGQKIAMGLYVEDAKGCYHE